MSKFILAIIGIVLIYVAITFFKGDTKTDSLVELKINSSASASTSSLDQKMSGGKITVLVGDNSPITASFSTPTTTAQNKIEINTIKEKSKKEQPATAEKSSLQTIRGTITDEDGLLPTDYTLKVGVPARFEIEVKAEIDPYGCMSTIMIQGLYNQPIAIKSGEKIVMKFTPKKTGEYYITCVMGNGWGVIKVIK